MAFATLIATILDPQDVSALSRVLKPLLIGYNLYALSVVFLFHYKRDAAARLGPIVHGIDLFWAVAVTSATGGASSHFSPPLYVFALLTAAFRWGLRETLITGAIATTLLVAQSGAALVGLLGTPLRVGDFVMRTTWLVLVAIVLGFLAERDKRLRAESDLLARITRQVSIEAGLRASVRAVITKLAGACRAESALLITEESTSGRILLWTVGESTPADDSREDPHVIEPAHRDAYLFPVPAEADAWAATKPRARGPVVHAVDATGRRVAASFRIPDQFPGAAPWRSLICLSALSAEGWFGRFILVNPALTISDDQRLRFLQTAWQQVRPALVNIDLLRRLRSRLDELTASRRDALTDETRLEAVMDALPTGVAITDAKGGTIRANAEFERIWGADRPTTDNVGDYLAYRARWIDTGRLVQPEEWASARAVQRGETVTGQLMEIERFDGGRAYVLNSAAPILDADGRPMGCAVALQDITRRIETEFALVRSEAALKRANDELHAANDALRRGNETLEARVTARTAELSRRTNQLRALARDLTRAEERERQRVAQVIHDHLQQLLSVARMKLGMALRQAGTAPPQEAISDADGLIAESLDITRSLTADLSPAILHRSGLKAALQWLGRKYAERFTLNVVVEADENPEVPEEIRVTLFRAVRELLFNVVKHAHVTSARVQLGHDADGRVCIVVSDDGVGFDPEAVRAREGSSNGSFGLFSVREHLNSLGCQLEVDSAPGRGASFTILGPLPPGVEP